MSGDWTEYCDGCNRPIAMLRRGWTWRVGGATITGHDATTSAVLCACGLTWIVGYGRQKTKAAPLVANS